MGHFEGRADVGVKLGGRFCGAVHVGLVDENLIIVLVLRLASLSVATWWPEGSPVLNGRSLRIADARLFFASD